ncbi:MAG: hypothetical protein KDA83_00375 [Planctomycetales bacterium]|nr:hypothetical protein [Planctomycetales bacterium]
MNRLRIDDLHVVSPVNESEQDQSFGAGLRRRRPKEFRGGAVEVLEAKQMLSATAAVVLKNGVLSVRGTERNDRIVVAEKRGLIRVSINGRSVNISNAGKAAKASAVKRVEVSGLGGNDRIDVRTLRRSAVLRGGAGNDTLLGGGRADRLDGGSGNDTLRGYAGNDRILGGSGNDSIDGGSGNDYLDGQSGNDRIKGGTGNDVLQGGSGTDSLYGGSGNDRLTGGDGADRLFGEAGDDRLWGDKQDTVLDDRSGSDRVSIANSAPTDILLSARRLTEGVNGAEIGRITVVDADVNDQHTLTVSDSRFEVFNGVLKLKDNVAIDFETEPSVQISITAKDSSQATKTSVFSIEVIDLNELPVIGNLKTLEIGRDSASTLVNLSIVDPDGDAFEVHASSSSDQVSATIVNNALKLTPALGFVGTSTITVQVKDKTSGKSLEKEFQLVVRGTRAELVNGVLAIRGSNQADHIRLNAEGASTSGKLVVLDGEAVIGTFEAKNVRAIQVEAGAGDDIIDLTQAVMSAWVHGGSGNDTIHGGSGADHLFGSTGVDKIYGNSGADVIYGGDDQFNDKGELVGVVDGGTDVDFLSEGTGRKLVASTDDRDIEAMDFEERSYFDLLHQFRDAHGFVISQTGDGIDQRGDAMLFTGLAATLAAQRGDSGAVLELLKTLKDEPFVDELGRTRLVRHPEVWDYVNENGVYVRERHAPVTKDGVVGVISAVYYAFKAGGMTEEVRSLAKEVATKYIDYLIANNWMTIDRYPEHYWETRELPSDENDPDSDKKSYFSNVFGEGGTRVMYKGVDGYALMPNDRYALKNAAAEMGIATQGWSVWGGLGVTLGKVLGDTTADFISGVADDLGDWASERVGVFLKSISFDESYSFHVIPGLDWTLVKGDVKLEISSANRAGIANLVGDAIRSTIKTLLGSTIDNGTELVALAKQLSDLQGRIVDQLLDSLPSWLQGDKWRPLVGDAIQQVLPWLSGDVFGELIAFTVSHRMGESDNIVAHLSFWPTLVALESRPELVDLLMPSIRNLDKKLNPSSSDDFFDTGASKMDMALYAWLAGEDKLVSKYIELFESDRRFDALAYAWKKDHKENVEKILGDGAGTKDSGNHRLEYLLLKSLQRRGTPPAFSAIKNDWIKHWREQLKAIGDQAAKAWQDLKSNLVKFAQALAKEFGVGLDKIGSALWKVSQSVEGIAAALWSVEQNLGKVAATLWSLKPDLGQVASALWSVKQDAVQVFQAMLNGAKVGFVDAIQAVVDGKLISGNAASVAKFLILDVKTGIGTGILQLKNWLNGDLAGAFWGAVNGANLGWKDALNGLTSSGLVANNSYEMAKFLLNTAKANLSTTATAISQWLNGNVSAAFWAICTGAGKSLKDAVNGIVWAGLVKNNSYEVAKFLLNSAGAGLSKTAKAISDWLGGDRDAAFWAIASGAGKGYVDATKALIWADLLGNSYTTVLNYLKSKLGLTSALKVVNSIF